MIEWTFLVTADPTGLSQTLSASSQNSQNTAVTSSNTGGDGGTTTTGAGSYATFETISPALTQRISSYFLSDIVVGFDEAFPNLPFGGGGINEFGNGFTNSGYSIQKTAAGPGFSSSFSSGTQSSISTYSAYNTANSYGTFTGNSFSTAGTFTGTLSGSTSGSHSASSFVGQTTTTSSNSNSIIVTTESTFAYSFPVSTTLSAGGVSTTVGITSINGVVTASTTTSSSYRVLTTTSAIQFFAPFYAVATGYAPGRGEVIFVPPSGIFGGGPISEMESHTDSFLRTAYNPYSVSGNFGESSSTISSYSTFSSIYNTASATYSTRTAQSWGFSGFTTITEILFGQTSGTFPDIGTAYFSSSTSAIGIISYSITSLTEISTTSVGFDAELTERLDFTMSGITGTHAAPYFYSTITTVVGQIAGSPATSFSSTAANPFLGEGTTFRSGMIVDFGTTFDQGGSLSVFGNNPIGIRQAPNSGYRLTPSNPLAGEIGIGSSLNIPFSSSAAPNQSVPMEYPFATNWVSNSESFTAIWNSVSLTVTQSTSTQIGTATAGGSSSSAFVWTSSEGITSVGTRLASNIVPFGTGAYAGGSQVESLYLLEGFYSYAGGVIGVTAPESSTITSGPVLSAVGVFVKPGDVGPLVEVATQYNQ